MQHFQSTVGINDLPLEMISKIVGKLDGVNRIPLRHVCKTLRAVVDRERLVMDKLKIDLRADKLSFGIDGSKMSFQENENGCLIHYEERDVQVKGDWMKIAMNELEIVMKKKKMTVKNLHLKTDNITKLTKFLDEFSFQLGSKFHVTTLNIEKSNWSTFAELLLSMEPGTLENIVISGPSTFFFYEMMITDQWKAAKTVDFVKAGIMFRPNLRKFENFKEFKFETNMISSSDLLEIKNRLLESKHFKRCEIHAVIDPGMTSATVLRAPIREDGSIHVPIPGSSDYLEFKIPKKFGVVKMEIERKKF